jgi:hypothetical protein
MRIKTNVKAGGWTANMNHNQTMVRERKGLRVKDKQQSRRLVG